MGSIVSPVVIRDRTLGLLGETWVLLRKTSSIQGTKIQCMKDQMEVSHVDKNMLEQSSFVHSSQSIRST